jgi:hypothetical protein
MAEPLPPPIFPPTAEAQNLVRPGLPGLGARGGAPASAAPANPSPANAATAPKIPATEAIARRAGALVDEIDFPGFVAGLVHGTFDAIVDASIRQMESFSSMVAAVAKPLEQFVGENVTDNQARDWLAQRHPGDVRLVLPQQAGEQPRLEPRREDATPAWLADFDLEGQTLSGELLEEALLPQVRMRIGAERQQLLSTMVLLGMNRVVVRDGTISSKVMFRASAQDAAKVGYATGSDPKAQASWGERGSLTQAGASTMVSTLGINAQSDASVSASLFGEVKLNFVSETLPLDRLADAARIALVQQASPLARGANPRPAATASVPAPAAGTPAPSAPPAAPPTTPGSER